jgi:ribulose-5-phosphate 4-epimerase/fuculose-1-phosphate aldolase
VCYNQNRQSKKVIFETSIFRGGVKWFLFYKTKEITKMEENVLQVYQQFKKKRSFVLEELMVEIMVLCDTELGKVVSSENLAKAYKLFEKMEQIAEITYDEKSDGKVRAMAEYLQSKENEGGHKNERYRN